MISVLSAVVLMLAIGTVIQRADLVGDYFGGETEVVLNMDVVDARANRLLRIDVFENDIGISPTDRDRLAVIGNPSCGQVFIQGQALQYLPDASCVGQAVIEYGIQGRDEAIGKVVAQVNGSKARKPSTKKRNTVVEEQVASVDVISKPETVPSVPSADLSPKLAETAETPDLENTPAQTESGIADVVDTLIHGTAQSVQAASANVKEREVLAETDATSEGVAENVQPELAPSEPDLKREAGAPLASPQNNAARARIGAGQNPVVIARASRTPALAPNTQTAPATAVKPQIVISAPALQIVQPREQRPVEPADGVDLVTAAAIGTERAPRRALQSAEQDLAAGQDLPASGEASDFLVAIVERREPNTRPPSALRMAPGDGLTPPTSATAPSIEGSEDRIARVDALSSVLSPDVEPLAALTASPVDTSQLPLAELPPAKLPPAQNTVLSSTPPPLKPRVRDTADPVATPDGLAATTANRSDVPDSPADPPSGELAALPKHDAPCVIPPAMTIDVRRAARTIVSVDAPCHAGTVAELRYSSLRVALPLDRFGKGSLTVLGFEPNAPALLTFVNNETIDFDLPFKGIGRVSRVAVVWDLPVHLELNAIEFGAGLGSQNHVRPENARGFEDVRRSGGGFLHGYRSHSGVGQNAQIYSFWHRRGGQQGVVELMIDYASRNRDRLAGTCGDGQYAAPNFLILRSVDARLERPVIRKLAALDCSRVVEEKGDKRLISGAVADLLIVQR